jgi:ABC-type dipeptide/oligopeptide/nickel transport system permease component
MNDSTLAHFSKFTDGILIYIGSFIVAYILLTLFVYKTKLFSNVSKSSKQAILSILSFLTLAIMSLAFVKLK